MPVTRKKTAPGYVEDDRVGELHNRLLELEAADRLRRHNKKDKRARKALRDVCDILLALDSHDMRESPVTPLTAAILTDATRLRSLITTYLTEKNGV